MSGGEGEWGRGGGGEGNHRLFEIFTHVAVSAIVL